MGDRCFFEELVQTRRELHRHAERGWEEFWTTAFIASRLQGLGFRLLLGEEAICPGSAMGRPSDAVLQRARERALRWGGDPFFIDRMGSFTGVVGVLETGLPGPVVAFRFDMDAVEVPESRDSNHRPFREGFAALDPEVSHSCGHDGHVAIGLTLAGWLIENKQRLRGTFKLLFQPAEEGVRGGKAMADRGVLDDVDFLWGFHIGLGVPTGTVCAKCGGFLCTTKMDVEFKGVAAHAGGAPHEGRNALLAAATAVLGLHAIAPHGEGVSRVNVGVLNAGSGRNVVPSSAELKLETRGSSSEIDEYLSRRAEEVLKGAAASYGVDVLIKLAGAATTARSDDEMVRMVEEAASSVEGVKDVRSEGSIGGSEDISWMMNKVQDRGGKACYFILGAHTAAGHHNGGFDLDEDALPIGVSVLQRLVSAVSSAR
ncbi:MAG: amidohydrolase [Thermanaerothrix sp.]|nr:amidohydrolase [Thermanaerothrix sp.]